MQGAKSFQPIGVQHRAGLIPLKPEEIRFEIDMCIGCDRCMKACPIPLSSMVNIADLNLATVSDSIEPHVARFTQECVMCGSCVPVCPVNNHRDLLMLSIKQRLGIPWDGKVDMNRILDYLPPSWTLALLLERLREMPMFKDTRLIPDNHLLHLVASSKMLSLMPGSAMMHEGEYGRELYLLLEGRFEASSLDQTGQSLPIAIIRRGEFVGERGMLTGQRREATVRAQTAAVVLQVPEQVMQRMMEIAPSVQQFFEQLNTTRSLETLLRRMALFQGIAVTDIKWLINQTHVRHYNRDEQLFSEDADGQPAREMLHVLLEGFVKVARASSSGIGERILAYRQEGDYFVGGLDLLGDGRAVTVTSINRVRVAEVPQLAMQALLMRYPEVDQRFRTRLQEYREAALAAKTQTFTGSPEMIHALLQQNQQMIPPPQTPLADREARKGLRALVGEGVIEGTEVLIIDLDKCVHCSECEEACARRHGHSRMNRKGLVVGNISVATACRHCQDPVCMLCSRAGIARMPSGEVYITESCIGCGICAERCPYDNITIVSLEGSTEQVDTNAPTWQRFTAFFKKGAGKERGKKPLSVVNNAGRNTLRAAPGPLNSQQPYDALGEMRKKLAIKCDLCAGYDNQACVQACPVGAALRVNPTTFFGSTEEILRKQTQ